MQKDFRQFASAKNGFLYYNRIYRKKRTPAFPESSFIPAGKAAAAFLTVWQTGESRPSAGPIETGGENNDRISY